VYVLNCTHYPSLTAILFPTEAEIFVCLTRVVEPTQIPLQGAQWASSREAGTGAWKWSFISTCCGGRECIELCLCSPYIGHDDVSRMITLRRTRKKVHVDRTVNNEIAQRSDRI
jgi:hypothetical protein